MPILTFFLQYWKSADAHEARVLRNSLILIVTSSFISGALHTALLGIINKALIPLQYSTALLGAFIALCVVVPLTRYLYEYILNQFLLKTVLDMQLTFCRQVLGASLRVLERQGSHRLAAILSDDIRTISDAMIALITVCMHGTIIVSCLAYMGWLSWQGLLLTVLFMVLGLGAYQFIAIRGQRYLAMGRQHYGELFGHFKHLTVGNKELKLHRPRRAAFFRDLFAPTADAFRRAVLVGNNIYNAARGLGSVLNFILIGIIVFALPVLVDVTSEVLSGFALALLYMMGPLESVVSRLITVDRAGIAIANVREAGIALNEGKDSSVKEDEVETLPPWESLSLREVVYSYADESGLDARNPFTLGPIDLEFQPGEVTLVVGGNGSGKTTLAKVVTGLYAHDSGRILYNDVAVTDENRDQYRQLFSTVFVDFHLFDTLLGLDGPDLDDRAAQVLEKLKMEDKVAVENGRFSTIELSQGQRKRLALLTAILEDRPFYVFDEWTANQDPQFREIFYKVLLPDLKRRNKAVLAITHDDKYFDYADRVVKLDFGKMERTYTVPAGARQ